MKRLMLAAVLAFGFASAQDLVTQDRIGPSDAPNAMTFAALAHFTNSNGLPEFAEGFQEAYEAFAEDHPDWRVDMQLMRDNINQEMARILEQARVGRAPACATIDSFQLALFKQQGALQPVSEHFTQEQIEDLFPYVRDGITGEDGEIYAYWFDTGLRVLYYRTDLVPEAPRTWDEAIEAAVAAQEADPSVDGMLFNGGRSEGTSFDFLAHFWSQGGDLVDSEGRPVFGEEPHRTYLANALGYYRDLVESGAAPRRVASIAGYDDMLGSIRAGSVAMIQGASGQWTQMSSVLEEDELAQWDVALPPAREADQFATGTGGWTIAALSDDPDEVRVCMDLAKSVYRGTANSITGGLPTSVELFDTIPRFQDDPYSRFGEFLEHGRARPGVAIYPEISNQLQIVISEILSGSSSIEDAIDGAVEEVDAAYQRLQ
ncbi:MAG: extracellular solute-binding protein [Trueperaceae bacterium]|nr:extracellular solute-binding protein [Trueperaceae bacterium]